MNAKNKRSMEKKDARKNANAPLIFAAVVVLCLAVAAVAIPKLGKPAASSDTEASGADVYSAAAVLDTEGGSEERALDDEKEVQVIEEGESLVIPVIEVSETVSFYPVVVDGTDMEILAVKDSEGNIRTAFNTCQICYGSGRGYYVQQGNTLVCQNCGNQFTVDQVEKESGGCNPWPIFADNKTVTEESISISYDFLKESKEIFENWKISD